MLDFFFLKEAFAYFLHQNGNNQHLHGKIQFTHFKMDERILRTS